MLGGVCLNTGTIPSKTLREAVLYLTGLDQREMYGQSYRVKDEITIGDLTARTHHVVSRENDVVRSQLTRNRVTRPDRDGALHQPEDGGRGERQRPKPRGTAPRRSSSRPGPSPPGRPASSSTSGRSSTRTASCS